jgi:SagB-type dehydrogenase family enzyme
MVTKTLPLLAFLIAAGFLPGKWAATVAGSSLKEDVMELPAPRSRGDMSVETAIDRRRTVRSFLANPLTREQLGQLLWAAQGITGGGGVKRAAPSAGALYPMDVYAVLGEGGAEAMEAGVYRYDPKSHALMAVSTGDRRRELARAALSQMWLAKAPVNLVVTAEYDRATGKYGERGHRYAIMEAGHIGQNLFLQATALDLAAGIVGAFQDRKVNEVLGLPPAHEPLLIVPIGHPRR